MSTEQRQLAEANLNLVDCVIHQEIQVSGLPSQAYEDYYQEGCEALCKAAIRYQPGRGRFESLAYTAVKHALIDYSEKQQNWRSHVLEWPQEGDPGYRSFLQIPDGRPSPDECAWASEVSDALEACRDRYNGVSQKGLEVIRRRYEGEEVQDLAGRYGVPARKVRSWLYQGRNALQKDSKAMAQLGLAA